MNQRNTPERWESIAVGLLTAATVLASATAVGGLEAAVRFGTGGAYESNRAMREALLVFFSFTTFSYVIAWGLGLSVLLGSRRWKETNTRYLGYLVFIQITFIMLIVMTVLYAAFNHEAPSSMPNMSGD